MEYPKELEPVFAKITAQGDLGYSEWNEVVYWNGVNWNSYGHSFDKNGLVREWVYCSEVFELKASADAAEQLFRKAYNSLNNSGIACGIECDSCTYRFTKCETYELMQQLKAASEGGTNG